MLSTPVKLNALDKSSDNDVESSAAHIPGVKAYKQRLRNKKWTEEEDNKMIELVQKLGTKKWSIVGGYLINRTGKQCRERWHNQLDPSISKGKWRHLSERSECEFM